MSSLTRRLALKLIGVGSAWLGISKPVSAQGTPASNATTVSWSNTHDRVWLGSNIWANPMEDWAVVGGAAECLSSAGNRNIHLITHQVTNSTGTIKMSVTVRGVETDGRHGGFCFRIGARSDINEFRSNSFMHNGINCGLNNGKIMIGRKRLAVDFDSADEIRLSVSGKPVGEEFQLTLIAETTSGKRIGELSESVDPEAILGNIALVNNLDSKLKIGKGSRFRFNDWTVAGDALTISPQQRFGPILWSQYSLSDSRSNEGFVMKLSALTGPLGDRDNQDVELLVQQADQWKSLGTAALDTDAWTATFRIPDWDEKAEAPYRLVYRQKHVDGSETESDWTGKIKANPSGGHLRIGALTCQNDYGFPYAPVAENLVKLDPDMLYFSGDQLYENHGGYGVVRDPADRAILNYLRKFYQHGWAFREAMRDRPTICIPDDHDVFHGNIWGEGGAAMEAGAKQTSSYGGYRQPVRMVNVVHKTNAAHHPDYFDPTPVKQGMSVYYGDMVYGGVGFAILGDRQFKSAPTRVDTGSGRADHVLDKDFDTSKLDKPGLELLGERQEKFLRKWSGDWRGHSMKVLLSQTVFAGVATHHGGYDGYLKADLDSGGWPQTARNRAIDIVRSAQPLHINGDQHLTTLAQYGVRRQRDSPWSFCTPAISAGYPRWWRPDELGMPHDHRPQHGLPDTGEFIEGFGNMVYVYAVGNPENRPKGTRYERAHKKGSGFGLVTVDTESQTYLIESFRFMIDATDGKASNQFPGWPVILHQRENGGDNVLR
jgi:alkaline phosphatase D